MTKDTPDVFFYEAFAEERTAIESSCPDFVRASYSPKTIQEAGHAAPPARIISIRTQSIIPAAWAADLDAILTRSAGYDHLTAYLDRTNARILCGYLPKYCVQAVAEQAMLLWTALLRKLPQQIRQFDNFHRDGLTGHECLGKTMLIVGVGNIGHQIAVIAQALGMKVLGVDIVRRHKDIDYIAFEDGLPQADIIVCAMNLTAQNRGYFNFDKMSQTKRGAVFVNVARGECSPSVDLLRLLEENKLAGVGLDVFNCESELAVALREGQKSSSRDTLATMELRKRNDAILTPHNSFNTEEAVKRKAEQSIEQIAHFLKHKAFLWPIPADKK